MTTAPAGAPLLTVGQVNAQNPDEGTLKVVLKTGGQMVDVRMGYNGPADALRIRQEPMPGRGTWGLVAFPYGDFRNGVWICAIYPGALDALTTTNAASGFSATDFAIDYEAHFSGFWRMLDGSGQAATQWPDGSYLTMALASGLPTTYRHTVNGNKRVKQPFRFSDRVPTPPSIYQLTFVHKSGTTLSINASGAVSVLVSGGGFTMDTSGNVSLIAAGTLTIASSGVMSFNTSGAMNINSAGAMNINASGATTIGSTGEIVIVPGSQVSIGGAGASDPLTLYNELKSAFDSHKHAGVTTGGGLSGSPTSPLSGAGSSKIRTTG